MVHVCMDDNVRSSQVAVEEPLSQRESQNQK
jgi:hypothetical protein